MCLDYAGAPRAGTSTTPILALFKFPVVDHTANAYIFSGYLFIYANIDITAVNVGVHMYTNMNIEDSIVD